MGSFLIDRGDPRQQNFRCLWIWINFNLTAKWAGKPNWYFSGHVAEISPQILEQSAQFRTGTFTVDH